MKKTTRMAENSRMVAFNVHLLVKYPKDQAQKELARKESEAQQNAFAAYDLYQTGKNHQSLGEHRQAKQFFREGLKLLAEFSTVILLQQEDIQNSRELVARLKSEEQKIIANLRRVVVWTWETNPSGNQPSSNMASHLQAVLQQYNFSIVDHPVSKANASSDLLDEAEWRGDQNVFSVLKSKGVQYLIVAQAETKFSSTEMKNHFYNTRGFLKVFSTQSGEAVMTLPINSRGYDKRKEQAGLQALNEAGTTVGKQVVKKLLAREDL